MREMIWITFRQLYPYNCTQVHAIGSDRSPDLSKYVKKNMQKSNKNIQA